MKKNKIVNIMYALCVLLAFLGILCININQNNLAKVLLISAGLIGLPYHIINYRNAQKKGSIDNSETLKFAFILVGLFLAFLYVLTL